MEEMVHLAQTTDWLIFEVATYETIGDAGQRFDATHEAGNQIVQALTPLLPDHTIRLNFINSAEVDTTLPAVLRDDWSDTAQLLKRMEPVGFLRQVKSSVGRGWVLTDLGRQQITDAP